eukprot:GHVO01043384.1.p2 GENE.GHVO01043384.1~~GHVO01043384.1.p2  ORF type:complete len:150 (+),score=18.60 GHVO01043384.1:140-589(+)
MVCVEAVVTTTTTAYVTADVTTAAVVTTTTTAYVTADVTADVTTADGGGRVLFSGDGTYQGCLSSCPDDEAECDDLFPCEKHDDSDNCMYDQRCGACFFDEDTGELESWSCMPREDQELCSGTFMVAGARGAQSFSAAIAMVVVVASFY